MKDIKEYIIEASNEFKIKMNNLKYVEKKPTSNQDEYIQIMTSGKTWKDEGPTVYVKTEDLGYTDQANVLSVAYNLMKKIYSKGIMAEIGTWDPEQNDYVTFAIAHLQKKNRMWHPEYISSDKYSFK